MNDRIFIVSGTHEEYKVWVRKNIDRLYTNNTSLSLSHFVYVSNSDVFRGYSEVHGYFIGSYRKRIDMFEICTAISIINLLPYNELYHRMMKYNIS